MQFEVRPGELIAIVGSVGSGKSSLLAAVVGQLPLISGELFVKGRIAYATQQAWMMNESLRQNVLFSLPFDEQRYVRALKAAQLLPDLEQLPAGDLTEIGERGINLSGGQKQRVSLARAVYSDRELYLLDDVLSAVDQHVGKQLFNECICGAMKGKTRLLVTNQLQYLPMCDRVIVLKKGQVVGNPLI
jgi:ABC-type multidrug transport system fused ATPase/permease subunit